MRTGARAAATLLSVLLLAGIIARVGAWIVLAAVPLMTFCLGEFWRRHCLSHVGYSRRLSASSVSFGSTVELVVEVTNRKLLPLPWLEVADELPAALSPTYGNVVRSWKQGRSLFTNLFTLLPYERVRRRYQFDCQTRGEHVFGPPVLRSGDPFGLAVQRAELTTTDRLVVCPRVVPLRLASLEARRLLGVERVHTSLFDDPSRLAGSREYQPGDSPRRIDWPASARAQRLQVRRYDPVGARRLLICLDVDTNDDGRWWSGYDPEVQELAFVVAASMARWAHRHQLEVGLCSNGKVYGAALEAFLSSGTRDEHHLELLRLLGRLMPFATGPVAGVLARQRRRWPAGTTIVLVTSVLLPSKARELGLLARSGFLASAIVVGDSPPDHLPKHVKGLTLAQRGESWRCIQAIDLV